MKYTTTWTNDKAMLRAAAVEQYWTTLLREAKESIASLPSAEREDKTHLGKSSKLNRAAEAAKANIWRARILLDQNNPQRTWEFTNDDLLWFYPDLAESAADLIHLGQ